MKINIATPEYGHTYVSEYVRSLYLLTRNLEQAKIHSEFSWISYNDIVEVRNFLISNFYFRQKDCSHILFIDADMGFPPQVVREMLDFDKPLVGVAATKREYNPSIKDKPVLASNYDLNQQKGGFVRVDQCGAGVMLISRECIDSMIKKLPDIVDTVYFKKMPFQHLFSSFLRPFDKVATDTAILSDDLSFCHRWVEGCGGEIWINVKHRIDHVGHHVFSSEIAS
jgi:hypothetical protein